MKQTPGADCHPWLHLDLHLHLHLHPHPHPHLSSATFAFDPDSCPRRDQHIRGRLRHLAGLPFANMIFRMICCPGAVVVVRPDESVCMYVHRWQGFR